MFEVHYLANHLLTRRLLASGVIPNDVFAKNGRKGTQIPRIVFVSSEAHRSSTGVDFDRFGAFVDYGITDGDAALRQQQARRSRRSRPSSRVGSRPKNGPSVAVHCALPGAGRLAHRARRARRS